MPASTRLKDLKGKGFATQPSGNTGEMIARHVLKVNGLSYNDVEGELHQHYTDSVEQMKDNQMQAFALGTGIPSGAVMDLASARDVKLIDIADIIEAMRKINPAYKLVTIPKGTYPKQDKDVQVIGYYTHVVAACSLPEERVYKMTTAIGRQRRPRWRRSTRRIEKLTPEGHGPGHRRAVPPRRGEVVQGEEHRREGDVAASGDQWRMVTWRRRVASSPR